MYDYETMDANSFVQELFSDDLVELYSDVFQKIMELVKAEKVLEKLVEDDVLNELYKNFS